MDDTRLDALGKQRYLFLSLLGLLLVVPIQFDVVDERVVNFTMLSLVTVTGPWAVARKRWQLVAAIVLAVLMVAPGWFSAVADSIVAHRFSAGVGTLFFAYIAALLMRELLFDVEEVNEGTLLAAVNVYVTIGIAFAFLYTSLGFFDPEAFQGKFIDAELGDQLEGYLYFSFVTLSTLGYGDITPSNTMTATFTYIEAVVGQLFIAITIARLVGLYIAARQT